jgi:hypothetical protein
MGNIFVLGAHAIKIYTHGYRYEIKIHEKGILFYSFPVVCNVTKITPSKLYTFIISLNLCLYLSITFLILLCFKTLGVESCFGTKQRMGRKVWMSIL